MIVYACDVILPLCPSLCCTHCQASHQEWWLYVDGFPCPSLPWGCQFMYRYSIWSYHDSISFSSCERPWTTRIARVDHLGPWRLIDIAYQRRSTTIVRHTASSSNTLCSYASRIIWNVGHPHRYRLTLWLDDSQSWDLTWNALPSVSQYCLGNRIHIVYINCLDLTWILWIIALVTQLCRFRLSSRREFNMEDWEASLAKATSATDIVAAIGLVVNDKGKIRESHMCRYI